MKSKNIVSFADEKKKLNKGISDDEINSLFMGLLKIVKKSAFDNANCELKNECKDAKQNFAETLKELHCTQIDLKKQMEINVNLQNKIESQQKQICYLVNFIRLLKDKKCQIN